MSRQVAIVTGGAKGLGWATVEAFVEAGIIPVLIDSDQQSIQRAIEELTKRSVDHYAENIDVCDEVAIERAFTKVTERYGRLDILVNNAAISIGHPTVELMTADWKKVLDVNLTAVFQCSRIAARVMIKAGGGVIVNVSSIMGLSGGAIYPDISYQATKGALVNLTRALAVEWATSGIRVNAVAPTFVNTDLTKELFRDPQLIGQILDMVPMRRLAEPSDVADAILFLASDRAKMVTGHTLPVDGGFLAQ